MSFKTEDYLPARFRTIKEFYDFCMANDPEFDNAEELTNKGVNNRFPDSADIDGVKIWEHILNITPNTSDTLEDRRFRIIANLQKRTPYTWSQLHKMMSALCGEDGYELKKGYFVLMLSLSMDSQSKLRSVIQMLRDVVPMHILLEITQLLFYNFDVDIISWRKNNSSLEILPYQERSYLQEMEGLIASASIQEKKLQILPYQKREFEEKVNACIASIFDLNKRIQILPFQSRLFEVEAVLQPASGVIIRGSIEILCQKKN